MSDVTLSQLFREYELFHNVKGCTKAKARSAFAHLVCFVGDVPVSQIGPGRINKWMTWLATTAINPRTKRVGLRPWTIKTTVGAAAGVFGWALRQREADGSNEYGLRANPFCDADAAKVDDKAVRYYTESEAKEILATAGTLHWRDATKRLAWYAAIQMAAVCGLRKGEVLNLRWRDVDLDGGRVLIRHRDNQPGQYWAWQSKGKHEGEVPMSDGLWQTMARLRQVRPWSYPFLMQCRLDALMARSWPLPESVRDCPAYNWSREFNRILRATNRQRWLDDPHAAPIEHGDYHQLRKSLGTWLAKRGRPEVEVRTILRHASAETTRRHYIGVDLEACFRSARLEVNRIGL